MLVCVGLDLYYRSSFLRMMGASRLENFTQIYPHSGANGAGTVINTAAAAVDAADVLGIRGVALIIAGRTKPPPAVTFVSTGSE